MISLAEARSRVREAGGDELCERLEYLDEMRCAGRDAPVRATPPRQPERGALVDYDVAIAGGGLWLLMAPLLAARGLKVAVLDRGRIGCAQREWNCSERELERLVRSGLFTQEELGGLVVARYRHGICRWYGGGSYPVTRVLDHAVDAGKLLAEVRARCEQRGVALLDGHAVTAHTEGPDAVALSVSTGKGAPQRSLTARILVDARGAASPFATADLVCPTVGGVLAGLEEGESDDQIQPDVGEILATTEGVEEGRQHIWEAFPGRRGEVTVYLFYYALAEAEGMSLLGLYARFFERLSRYKRGEARLLRPTFGYIPGWSRLGRAPSPPGPRVVLVGDVAARHSPLTFCGFGSALRSFALVAEAIAQAAQQPSALPRLSFADDPIHTGTGALSRMMATPPLAPGRAGELNTLLDAAFAVLYRMGDEAYGALLRDEMGPADFLQFLRETAALRPRVYRDVLVQLGLPSLGRWGLGLARELLRERAGRVSIEAR
jgi:lycopene cyclase CruA